MTSTTEEFVTNLLSQMTLDEKVGQLTQIDPRVIDDVNIVWEKSVGSVLNATSKLNLPDGRTLSGADLVNWFHAKNTGTRLKVPLLMGRDVIHGYRTVFPIPLAQAATFNPELAAKAASVAALEASGDGIKWTFAPMLDIARDPRWGRVAEGNGEDPYLGAQMASSLVRGYQGEDIAQPNSLVACAKHYVGYGAAEGGRDYENGEISEPTLRDIYLPPFESAVRAGVGTVMSAFIDLNGIPATGNRWLIDDILRGEMGFDGFVVSDWESVAELIPHGIAQDRADAAALALRAGVDMDMVSRVYLEALPAALQAGTVNLDQIDESVLRILRLKHKAGLFARPLDPVGNREARMLTDASRQLARQMARQSMVLLKNRDHLLPLREFRKILVAGPFVNAQAELFGTWTFDGRPKDAVPLDQAFINTAPKNIDFWFDESLDKAMSHVLGADAVILLLGEHPRLSGENANLSDIELPPGQAAFMDAMVNLEKPVILVVFAGRPLAITREMSQADAVLFAWHPGIEGAAALCEILFGIASPSGRLPITLPRATGQIPIYYNHKNSGRPISPGSWYRARYLDLPTQPLAPFGYGLTYTSFEYGNLQVSDPRLSDVITVSAEITNLGDTKGNELVQLYVRDLVGSRTRPVRELKGFQRIDLNPGESKKVSFMITPEMLAFTRADGSRGVEPGRYQVWIAPDSASGLMGEFSI